jgi:flagellar biosynthesis protein FliQ
MDALPNTTPLPEGTVVDLFLSINWITVAMVIGVFVSVIGALVYIRPDGR